MRQRDGADFRGGTSDFGITSGGVMVNGAAS
jgi:hypothetical protein